MLYCVFLFAIVYKICKKAKNMTNQELITRLKEEGYYLEIRELEDGSIAGLGELFDTRAIYTNMNNGGYESRYCFSDREKANEEFWKLKDMNSEPAGYTAKLAK